MQQLAKVDIYTDGACSGNPGPGGWAAILKTGKYEKEISGFEKDTTNNRMELTAALEALKALKKPCQINFYSDSAYLIKAFNEKWLENWQKNNWKNSAKQPVSNSDLWKQFIPLIEKHQIDWFWVKGHADNPYNNRCDELAVQAIERNR
ncbi:MAG: ribonuclease HI [Clostridiaceae bacterium]|nr:ribonuclease HI [Clostridiaceae bacterium]